MAACFADFRHRSIQYRLGVGLNFFGLGLFVTAFLLPELYTYTPGPGDVGLSVGQGDQMRVSVGLWEMCADGLRTCRGISLDHFPGWFVTARVFFTGGLVCYLTACVLATGQLCAPSLSYSRWSRLQEAVTVAAGVNGMVGLCILGTNVRHSDPATGSSLSIAWMVSLLASLLAFFAAINVFQGRYANDTDADGLQQHTLLPTDEEKDEDEEEDVKSPGNNVSSPCALCCCPRPSGELHAVIQMDEMDQVLASADRTLIPASAKERSQNEAGSCTGTSAEPSS